MTAVQAAPASPPAPPEELTTPELARSAIFSDAVVIARRNLTRIARTPQLMVFATIQPVMFVLLFRYVFGGAIHVPGISYVDFLIPGVIVQTVVFGATSTAVGLSQDMSNGIIDRFRFRSLPMSRSAVLAGRTIADLVRNVFVVLLMIVVGMAVGFRFHNGFLPAVAAVFVALPIGYALSWVFALIGLTVADPETAQLAGFLPIFPLVSPARSSSRSRACPAGCRPSPKTSPLAEPPAPCGPSPKAAPSPPTSSGPSCGAPPSWPSSSPWRSVATARFSTARRCPAWATPRSHDPRPPSSPPDVRALPWPGGARGRTR
jgi:ABC-2 type transport system permease protein/oleandomycin transport system permease protein